MSKNYAVILAGGTGIRMGIGIPKQLLKINNKPIIAYTIEAFQNHPMIDGIIIVIHADYIDQIERLKKEYDLNKIIRIIPGGETRQGSSYNAITGYDYRDDDILLFHDAVRPFLTGEIIDKCIEETVKYGAVDVCVNTTDTIVQGDKDSFIEHMPDRNLLRNGQTPQCFRYKIIREAHEKARNDNFVHTTDDVRLLINMGLRVKIVEGSYENIKITTANDMVLAEAIALNRRKIKSFNVHKIILQKPGIFKDTYEVKELFGPSIVAVRPVMTSICQADLRYYTGSRRPEALAKKLPMALLHEGVGIIEDANGNPSFKNGDRVIIIPNIPGCVYDPVTYNPLTEPCSFCGADYIYENHCKYVRFLSSGNDGLSQSILLHPAKCLLKITNEIPDDIASMSELFTVSYNAVKRIDLKRNSNIMIFGDGPVGYMTSLIIHKVFNFPRNQIHVVGVDRLQYFTFTKTYTFEDLKKVDACPDYIFECVGGKASEEVVNKAIEIINPAGKIVLMGVSEELIKFNTRDILEKGISILGSSRSSRYDYVDILTYLKDDTLQKLLKAVIIEKHFDIKSSGDLNEAFSYAARKTEWGKVVMKMLL